MIPPKVFISYSHDSAAHKKWVLDFATTLRNRGIDAILDQWDLRPGEDVPQFMEQSLESADFAVMVCTKRYVAKANAGEGGVGYEKMIMTSSCLKKISDNKVIPIVRENGEPNVPTFLRSKLYIDFSKDEDVEFALDDLLRFFLDAPLYEKPEVGKNPFQPLTEARPDRTADGLKQLIMEFISLYSQIRGEYLMFDQLLQGTTMPRMKFDKYYHEAINKGILKRKFIYLELTDKGRQYAEEHGLFEV